MAFTYKEIGQGRYNNTTNNTVYTVPALTTTMIRSIRMANNTASSCTIRLFLVPNAGVADQTTCTFYDFHMPANHTLSDDGLHILETGGTLVFQNSVANAVTITVSGAEQA